ncbi:unnamed protein product, partial [Closterium sp. NIES-53]
TFSLRSSTLISTTAASTTPIAATIATPTPIATTIEAPTPATTPTVATTSATSTASTASTTTTPAATATTLATLALAVAALPTKSRSSLDILSTKDVNSSSRRVGGGKGGSAGGAAGGGGNTVARASTVLPCPAVPSGFLSGLHLPTFSTNLVSNAAIQDVGVDTIIPGGQRVAICQVAVTSQVSASGQLAASCSCRVLSHQTLLWHNRFGHPSLLRLQSMHSRLFVSDLPRSLPSLPRLPAVPCLPCIEGQQRAAPHSSEFPSTTAPLQTLHMDFWGSALVGGTDQERYFVLVVDDYTRYTTVFPLRCKADDSGVLIPWICATRRQLREWFIRDLPILRLHSDRAGEFSSDLLMEIRSDKGIHQLFTLLAYSQQNGIAERCIGLIMEVSRTSMIHAAAPHFLWPFAVRYAAH